MPLVEWKDMTEVQRSEAIELRPRWESEVFPNFAFWIKPDGSVSRRFGHHSLTEEAFQRQIKKLGGYRQKPDEPHAFNSGTRFTVIKGGSR